MPEHHKTTEDNLADRIHAGVEEAFQEYYLAYRTTFYQFTYQLIRNREVAKDIVSDTYLTCWQMRARFNTMKDIQAYIYVTCRNKAYNYLKYGSGFKNKKEVLLEDTEEGVPEVFNDASILREIIRREAAVELHAVMNHLSDQRRSVIQLHFIEGFPIEEVAKKLNISRELARTVKSKALAQLRSLLDNSSQARIIVFLLSF